MSSVAETYDFNDHAIGKLNETIKNVLDPNDILAPGKNGIGGKKYNIDKELGEKS